MIGLAKKHGLELTLPKWKYAEYFNYTIPVTPNGKKFKRQLTEPTYHYSDFKVEDETDVLGYLQSEKYWINAVDEVKRNLSFKQEILSKVTSKYSDAFSSGKELIGISIRRGDYVNNPNYYLLPIEYYINSLLTFFPNWRESILVIFTDDVEYCKIHFGCLDNVVFTESKPPSNYFDADRFAIEQLALMVCCDHYIISNSTFSWWGAYLGKKPHTKIIRPTQYMIGKLAQQCDIKDLYPSDWFEYDYTKYKINLKNVTFTVPVAFDHKDRIENLTANIAMLYKTFDTNIIIGEQAGDKFQAFGEWCKYHKFNYKEFHRTKMLNVMAKMSDTEIVVNHDADVFLPPMQIIESVYRISQGVDMVYPYDGRFARVNRKYLKELEQFMDVGILYKEQWPGTDRKKDLMSVGGCIFFNKERFFDFGGENERFISYGPEDYERYDRFNIAGARVERVRGMLYHIDHHRGENSTSGNKYFHKNHKEYDMMKVFNKEQMKKYIANLIVEQTKF